MRLVTFFAKSYPKKPQRFRFFKTETAVFGSNKSKTEQTLTYLYRRISNIYSMTIIATIHPNIYIITIFTNWLSRQEYAYNFALQPMFRKILDNTAMSH